MCIRDSTCPACGGAVHQDEDTLDTWFSSALWPFSTPVSYTHLDVYKRQLEDCVFVFELAERNTDRLLDYLPRMLAWAGG